jgi:hypothetical protein
MRHLGIGDVHWELEMLYIFFAWALNTFPELLLKVAVYVLGFIVRSDVLPDLPEILGRPCGHRRGVGNSFQPAIDASRFHLIICVIAPSAKMNVHLDLGACMSMNC